MVLHRYLVLLGVSGILWATPALSKEAWVCTSKPTDDPAWPAATDLYEVIGEVLLGAANDYDWVRAEFEIVENTPEGLIAIDHYSRYGETGLNAQVLISVTINKRTGQFRFAGYNVDSYYEDVWRGNCSPKVP